MQTYALQIVVLEQIWNFISSSWMQTLPKYIALLPFIREWNFYRTWMMTIFLLLLPPSTLTGYIAQNVKNSLNLHLLSINNF